MKPKPKQEFWGSLMACGTPRYLRSGVPEWNGRTWTVHPLVRDCKNWYSHFWWNGWLVGVLTGVAVATIVVYAMSCVGGLLA